MMYKIAPHVENDVKESVEPPEKKQKRSESSSQHITATWSEDCNFASNGGLKCIDCLKSFNDPVDLMQHIHEDHHSFAEQLNSFSNNENIFVPNAILDREEYNLGKYQRLQMNDPITIPQLLKLI